MRRDETVIKKNVIYNVIYQILILIVPLITTPYVSRVLLPEGVGTYAVTTAVAKYFWLFALLGMRTYGNRAIAKEKDDKEKKSNTFWNLFSFQMIFSLILLLIYILYLYVSGYQNYGIVSICQIPYVLSALFEVSWFFSGTEQFRFMVVRNAIVKIVTTVTIFVFVNDSADVWVYVLVNSLSILVGQLCLWPVLLKELVWIQPKWKIIKSHFKPNCILFISVVSVSIYTLLDKIIIECLNTTTELGYFENGYKITDMCASIIGAIGAVMLPRMSNLIEKKDKSKVAKYIDFSTKYMMIFAIGIAFGMAGVGNEFSGLFFGAAFLRCGSVLATLAPCVVFFAWENIIKNQYLLPTNQDKVFVHSTIYAALVNMIINVILVRKYGAVGAAIGTVSALGVASSYQTFRVRKELPIKYYIFRLIPFVICGAIMFAFCRLIASWMPTSILTLCLQIIGGFIIYIVCCFLVLVFTRDRLLLEFLYRIVKR